MRSAARGWASLCHFCLRMLVLSVILNSGNAAAQQNASAPSKAAGTGAVSARENLSTGQPPSATEDRSNAESGKLRLGPGDLVEVGVYGIPELATKARVGNSGDLYLPLIDYVHVGDLTLEEAQRLIEKRLSNGGFVKNPHVTVFIDEYASQAVTVLGEVSRPGVYPVMGERRLFDLVSAAGGFTEKAGKIITITHRDKPNQPVAVHLPQRIESSGTSNVEVLPGDTIVVARAGIVYVVGDVGRPSGFFMDSGSLTVLQAIAMAGGTNKTARLNAARIIRKTPQGMQDEPIALNKILHAKMQDLPMQADDILFVPSSAGKTAAYRGIDAVVQATTALTIVAAHP
jgi:polysaccharide biosynthesis/export protein